MWHEHNRIYHVFIDTVNTDICEHKYTQSLRWDSLQVSGKKKGLFDLTHHSLWVCVCVSLCVYNRVMPWFCAYKMDVCTLHIAYLWVLQWYWFHDLAFCCVDLYHYSAWIYFTGKCNIIFPCYVYKSRESFILDKALSLDGRDADLHFCLNEQLVGQSAGWQKHNVVLLCMSSQISLRLTVICWLNTSGLFCIFVLYFAFKNHSHIRFTLY